jgi:hypothetical protein
LFFHHVDSKNAFSETQKWFGAKKPCVAKWQHPAAMDQNFFKIDFFIFVDHDVKLSGFLFVHEDNIRK